MAINKCKICNNDFYTKPSHIKKGWGKFCSRKCSNKGLRSRKQINCYVCNILLYKTSSQMARSKSKKFFCGKSCQTKWRNKEYSGNRHLGWRGGQSLYRKIMMKSNILPACLLCNKKDIRILAVHHIDKDHSNTKISNLAWLCHNCHYLAHHDKLEKQRFENIINLK